MKSIALKLILIIALIALLISIVAAYNNNNYRQTVESSAENANIVITNGTQKFDIIRVADEEAGVICYVIVSYSGLSCMPKNQTLLP